MESISLKQTQFLEINKTSKKNTPVPEKQEKISSNSLESDKLTNNTKKGTVSNEIKFVLNDDENWGSRSQINGTYNALQDLNGNKDGIWGNEDESSNDISFVKKYLPFKPLLVKASESLKVGFSQKDEIKELNNYLEKKESEWGQKMVSSYIAPKIENLKLFSVQKAISLELMDRSPNEVSEGFVTAKGKVNNENINPREVFWQRFKPIGEPSGKVVLISPGFQETGRNFYEQINELNSKGHDVIVMDHQWAGQTKGGEAGKVDRGFGVARDVASMTVFAQDILEENYPDNESAKLILYGNSMGGGPGVFGAVTLNDNNLIELEGKQMPKNIDIVLQAPFLEAKEGKLLEPTGTVLPNLLSKVPYVNEMKIYSMGLPNITNDKVASQKVAQGTVLEDVRAQSISMKSPQEDLDFILKMIENDQKPKGNISIVHGKNDPLADSAKSQWLSEKLGDQVNLKMIESNNHVLQQSPSEQMHIVDLIN